VVTDPLGSAVDAAQGGGALRLVEYNYQLCVPARRCLARQVGAGGGFKSFRAVTAVRNMPCRRRSCGELRGVVFEFLIPAVRLQRVSPLRKPRPRSGGGEAGGTERWHRCIVGFVSWGVCEWLLCQSWLNRSVGTHLGRGWVCGEWGYALRYRDCASSWSPFCARCWRSGAGARPMSIMFWLLL
jgi:hypothetical protein